MVFSSPVFLFLFLPVFLLAYFLLMIPARLAGNSPLSDRLTAAGNVLILFSSLVFYFWGEAWLVGVMMTSTIIDYLCGLGLGRTNSPGGRKGLLALSITTNLALLAYFKYSGFGVESFNALAAQLGLERWRISDWTEVALPLGISFYTFQSMSYTIDVYRREVEPTRRFFDFACFVTMFPQLVAGPIVRYRDVVTRIRRRTISGEGFSSGAVRFMTGLAKKVLIANTVALPADQVFSLSADQLTPGLAWLGIISYTLQIYFDFSGYSDMAIGLGRMLGFSFPENFNYPYSARSIQDFWRRWHISLSTWFRDYLYIPLGGGRARPERVYFNLVLVFFLCGLWHGASWVFVVWGLYHGGFLVLERLGLTAWLAERPRPLRHLYVMVVVMGGWVLFRADDFSQATAMFAALAGFAPGDGLQFNVPMLVTGDVLTALLVGSVLSWPLVPGLKSFRDRILEGANGPPGVFADLGVSALKLVVVLAGFFLSAMSISSGAYNPFIYFRF